MDGTLENLPIDAIVQWDVVNWVNAIEFWYAKTTLDTSNCRVLDIGANDGGVSLLLALKGANVVCSDLNGPTEKAKKLHKQYLVSDHITYSSVNACEIPFENDSFDIVAFKSVLGAMRTCANQENMMKEIYRVLKPGGELWFAENLTASAVHKIARRWFVAWGKSWRYVKIAEIDELCQPFKTVHIKPYGFFAAFGRNEKQRRILGKIDGVINGCIPSAWKYIVFAVAKK